LVRRKACWDRFYQEQNKIQTLPAVQTGRPDRHENWVMMGADVKGDIYEGLLEKNAEDTKSGPVNTLHHVH
jgi:type I restriction enzyme M protein